ncbi:MAG: metallophosphoesterase [Oscillospiraceae bacterium]|nr:metallophosphoesterase [Oscillospiraceae bacterium]
MKILKRILVILVLIAVAIFAALRINAVQREHVVLKEYHFRHREIPQGFNGYRILAVSDLHEAPFAEQIALHIKKTEPDIVVFTGDMNRLPDDSVRETVKLRELVKDIPMYAVSGNHERQNYNYYEIIAVMKAFGITPLENDGVWLENREDKILLIGAEDPNKDNISAEDRDRVKSKITEELPEEPCFSILLFHRAGMYPDIKDTGVDLILAGDIHGGVARLPFIGGIFGNSRTKKYFPDYDYGMFREGDGAAMIVNGGCDKDDKKKRYFNPPEVVLVTLESE